MLYEWYCLEYLGYTGFIVGWNLIATHGGFGIRAKISNWKVTVQSTDSAGTGPDTPMPYFLG